METFAPRLRGRSQGQTGIGRIPQPAACFRRRCSALRSHTRRSCSRSRWAENPRTPVLVLQLVPVRRNARDIFGPETAILIATAVGQVGPPEGGSSAACSTSRLPKGASPDASLAEKALATVASALGIGQETVRTHLKSVLRKTGVNRQAQLVSLLSGIPHGSPALDQASQT